MAYKTDYIEEGGLVYEVHIYPDGTKHWFYKDKLYRLNGPAVEFVNGAKKYYINNKCYRTFEEYKEAVVQLKIKEILGLEIN